MPSKALLLDVDGVVLHQPRVMHRLGHKVIQFVQKHIPGKKDILQAAEVNTLLYSNFGHTHRGMRELYGKQAPSLTQFNQFVYDNDLLSYLTIHEQDELLKKRRDQLRSLVETALSKNIPCYLFSNAPDIWCNTVLDMMSMSTFFPSPNRLTSSHPVFQEKLLKPDKTLYQNVATFIEQTHRDAAMELVFVDDSLVNLAPILHSSGWTPVLLKETGVPLLSDKLNHVQKLDDVKQLLF